WAYAVPTVRVCIESRRLRLSGAVDSRMDRDDDLHAVISRLAHRHGFAGNLDSFLDFRLRACGRHYGHLCRAGKISVAHRLAEHVGPAQAASRGAPKGPCLARGIRFWSGFQHSLHCLVALTLTLR